MKKETKKQIATNLLLALFGGVLVAIAIKCGRMNQAKHIEKSTVKNYENRVKSRRIDKVSDTDNQAKLDWLEQMYNYQNEKL
jgi:hypothetical protein